MKAAGRRSHLSEQKSEDIGDSASKAALEISTSSSLVKMFSGELHLHRQLIANLMDVQKKQTEEIKEIKEEMKDSKESMKEEMRMEFLKNPKSIRILY